MSTAPETDDFLRVTVKRVEDGRVSRWINQALKPGDMLDVMPPAGRFCLRRDEGGLVLLGGGSGITPLLSLAKAALAGTARPVTLVYANRDRDSIIFAAEFDALAQSHGERFRLIHWIDSERGFIDEASLRQLGIHDPTADYYICGPAAFMDLVEAAVLQVRADRDHVFVERFVSPPDGDAPAIPVETVAPAGERCETLTVSLRGQTQEIVYQEGDTILQAAWEAGLRPPLSCLQGNCATCMARITQGSVTMYANNALTPSEVEQGYVLTCQAIPTARHVAILYEE